MPLTLACKDLGSPCDVTVSGETMNEIVDSMCKHAMQVHGYTKDQAYSEESLALYRSALKQSSRPAGYRSPKLDV